MISVVTPSRNQLSWLKLCIASVADQGVEVEHLVQDAASTDGTVEWVRKDGRAGIVSEPDSGMYDALNRGLRRAGGDILCQLNCDEQYLPGALAAVLRHFEQHPALDIVFAWAIVVDASGQYLCHRKVVTPALWHTWACHLGTLTCATFFRRRVLHERELWFNPSFKSAGDAEWVMRLLRAGVSMDILPIFTSAFTLTGDNVSVHNPAGTEWDRLQPIPAWLKMLRPGLRVHHRLRRLAAGAYFQDPFEYAIHTPSGDGTRRVFRAGRPTGRWPTAPSLNVG